MSVWRCERNVSDIEPNQAECERNSNGTARTRFPGSRMTADPRASPKLTKAVKLKGNGCRLDMFSGEQKTLTRDSKQEVNKLTNLSSVLTNSVEEIPDEVAAVYHESTRTPEDDALPIERAQGFDDWWNHSSVQLYQMDEEEQFPYWLDHTERIDSNVYNTQVNDLSGSLKNKTVVSDHDSNQFKSPHGHEHGEVYITTKTDERIQSLRALLAEQEETISRLRSDSKARLAESKEVFRILRQERSGCGQIKRNMPITQNSHTNETKNPFCKELRCTCRKRISSEDTGFSNSKRYRYNFRKSVQQQFRKNFEKKTGEVNTFPKYNFMTECVCYPDVSRKDTLTQEEFLSSLGLFRNTKSNGTS